MFEVVADREAAYAFCCEFFSIGRTEHMKGLVLRRDGVVIGATVYDEYNGSNIFMHCAGRDRRWLNRWFLHEAFKYPFVTLGCKRITLWVEKTNIQSRRFVHHLGFTQEAILGGAAADGGDVIIYRMFRDDCKYA